MAFTPVYFDLSKLAGNPAFNLSGAFSAKPTIPNAYNWGNAAIPNQFIAEAAPKAKSGIGLYVFQQLLTYGPNFIAGDPSAPRTANLFGIPTSTLILGALVVIGYFTFKKDSQPAYRRR
jgi:hypothetical protein